MFFHNNRLAFLFLIITTTCYAAQENTEYNRQAYCHEERRRNISDPIEQPSMLVLNYSQKATLQESHESFRSNCLSTHYIIDKNGDIYEAIGENLIKILSGCTIEDEPIINHKHIQRRAWHTGNGYWNGCHQEINNINTHAIGIVFVNEAARTNNPSFIIGNPENKIQWDEFTYEQETSFIKLAKKLQEIYGIADKDIVGYNEVRTSCGVLSHGGGPGPKFPWKSIASRGVGIYHNLTEQELSQVDTSMITTQDIQESLHVWGYSVQITGEEDAQTLAAIKQAQIHHDSDYYHAEQQHNPKRMHMIMQALLAQHLAKTTSKQSVDEHDQK